MIFTFLIQSRRQFAGCILFALLPFSQHEFELSVNLKVFADDLKMSPINNCLDLSGEFSKFAGEEEAKLMFRFGDAIA